MFPTMGGFYPKMKYVKIMENPYGSMDDLGVFPIIFGNTHLFKFTKHFGKVPKMEVRKTYSKQYGYGLYGLWIRENPPQ